MISLETIRQQLKAASGVEPQMNTLVAMLYRWSKRYNTRALNMCERVREASFPFLYNDEAAEFKAYALEQIARRQERLQRQLKDDVNYDIRMLALLRRKGKYQSKKTKNVPKKRKIII